MSANDKQIGGNHYQNGGSLQHWDLVEMFDWDYFQGQITKYIMRWKKKGGIQDLHKARHFLDKYIELEVRKSDEKNSDEYFPECDPHSNDQYSLCSGPEAKLAGSDNLHGQYADRKGFHNHVQGFRSEPGPSTTTSYYDQRANSRTK